MPHLKPSVLEAKTDPESHSSEQPAVSEIDYGGNSLMSLATSASNETPQVELNRQPSQAASLIQVTPSPHNAGLHQGYEQYAYYGYESHPPLWTGAVAGYGREKPMGVYGVGTRRLFSSPIRYTRTTSVDEDVDESSCASTVGEERQSFQRGGAHTFRGQPPHVHPPFYGPRGAYSFPSYAPSYGYNGRYPPRELSENIRHSPVQKRSNAESLSVAPPPKRWKQNEEHKSLKSEGNEPNALDHGHGLQSPASSASANGSKQRVISPSSSIEGGLNPNGKTNDEEGACKAKEKIKKKLESPALDEVDEEKHDRRLHYCVPEHRYGASQGMYPTPHYAAGPGMYRYAPPSHYGGISPSPGAWRMALPNAYPPVPAYVVHPSYPPSFSTPYIHAPMPLYHQRFPPPECRGGVDTSPRNKEYTEEIFTAHPMVKAPRIVSNVRATKIKSVEEWQRVATENGKPPSANRCIPLKAPIPSKYWGEVEKRDDFPIPDFHQLVNFPDYLNRLRSNGIEPANASASINGKRPCVMCGKQRICSASSTHSTGNALRRNKKQMEEEKVLEDDDSNHIIPRQNKGLCTACDICVWVFVDNGLEIKWCKGCKNFRPWAAFGDKGMATKCVRCRDRQREKYAIQKDELRLRRHRQNRHAHVDEECDSGVISEQHELAAVNGLRDLMTASAGVQ